MSRILLILAVLAVLSYLGLCLVLYLRQRSMIFLPQPRSAGAEVATLPLFTDAGLTLVSLRPHRGPQALLYFGGNAEDVSPTVPELAGAFPDHAVYAMHYRGYGGSSGVPSEAGLFADALALFDRISPEHTDVLVVGRSLGSGVAAYLASRRPLQRLVLATPYDSVMEVAAQKYRWFPIRWLIRDKFESWRYVQQISVPTRIVMAEHDDVIPRAHSEALIRHFRPGVASSMIVAGSTHEDIAAKAEYMQQLKGEY